MASSTPCFQPKPACPIPSGFANAPISAATMPTRTTTIPVCFLDMAARRLSLPRAGHVLKLMKLESGATPRRALALATGTSRSRSSGNRRTSVQLQIEMLAADRNGNSLPFRAVPDRGRLCAEARHTTGLRTFRGLTDGGALVETQVCRGSDRLLDDTPKTPRAEPTVRGVSMV